MLGSDRGKHGRLDLTGRGHGRHELNTAEEMAATLPHRERYLRLVHSLGRALIRVHEEWLDEVGAS